MPSVFCFPRCQHFRDCQSKISPVCISLCVLVPLQTKVSMCLSCWCFCLCVLTHKHMIPSTPRLLVRSIIQFTGQGNLDWSLDLINKSEKYRNTQTHTHHAYIVSWGQFGHRKDKGHCPLWPGHTDCEVWVCAHMCVHSILECTTER